jgi:hypothetical protein
VTAGDARRRGHARALVQQLQDRLREAGVKQLVVLIEPGVSPVTRRHPDRLPRRLAVSLPCMTQVVAINDKHAGWVPARARDARDTTTHVADALP